MTARRLGPQSALVPAPSQTQSSEVHRPGARADHHSARSVARSSGWSRSGRRLLLALCVAILLCQRAPREHLRAYRGLLPDVPATAQSGSAGSLVLNLPTHYAAPVYLSPVDGVLISEWPGRTLLLGLGLRFDDGHAGWQLVRDPSGNEGWVAELFLAEDGPATGPPADEDYLGPVRWDGSIVYCANPNGGPPGLEGDAFVALVERAAARWQDLAEGALPLVSLGRCESDATALGDGQNTVGWVDDLGLVIAAQTWPNAETGIVSEMDVRVSRGYFLRLQERHPARALQRCVFSTLVHEIGHVLGLDHPRSRLLPSSMQGVGASRCDKGQPTGLDKENLLRRYASSTLGLQ